MKNKLLFVLFFFSFYTTNAQVTFTCAAKNYTIPEFKDDSLEKNIWEQQFEKLGILRSIRSSNWDVELRCYYDLPSLSGSAIVVKGNENKIFAEIYRYRVQNGDRDSVPPKGYNTIRKGGKNIYYSVKIVSVPDTLLKSLIEEKLFSCPDITFVLDSLNKNGTKLQPSNTLDAYTVTFLVKVKSHIRRFSSTPFLSYANPLRKDLARYTQLFNSFDQLNNTRN